MEYEMPRLKVNGRMSIKQKNAARHGANMKDVSRQKMAINAEPLLYRPDMPEVASRLNCWWNGGDIGRPVIAMSCPRQKALEEIPEMPKPEGWITDYATWNFEYRVNIALRRIASTEFLGEAVPAAAPHLAPNCLALFLGCKGMEAPGTVFCEPFLESPDEFGKIAFSESNPYWDFSLRLGREFKKLGKGKFLTEFPDLIEGLDTLAAMRGTQELLVDLMDRPDWVKSSLERIVPFYFQAYDRLYSEYKDSVGGSDYWIWAPGRVAKLQCDFSAMISPDMFEEFMLPTLNAMAPRFAHCLYHWDGPGAEGHLKHILSVEGIDMVQWTAGDGHEAPWDKRWHGNFHKIIDAGKRVYIWAPADKEILKSLKKEFGEGLKSFLFATWANDRASARDFIDSACF